MSMVGPPLSPLLHLPNKRKANMNQIQFKAKKKNQLHETPDFPLSKFIQQQW